MWSFGSLPSRFSSVGKCLVIPCVTWIFHSILAGWYTTNEANLVAPACLIFSQWNPAVTQFECKIVRDQFRIKDGASAQREVKTWSKCEETCLTYEFEFSFWLLGILIPYGAAAASFRVSFDTNKVRNCDICKGEVDSNRTQFNRQFSWNVCVHSKSVHRVDPQLPSPQAHVMQCKYMLHGVCSILASGRSVSHFFLDFWQETFFLKAKDYIELKSKSLSWAWNVYICKWSRCLVLKMRHATCLDLMSGGSWPRLLDEKTASLSLLLDCRLCVRCSSLKKWIYFFIWLNGESGERERRNIN